MVRAMLKTQLMASWSFMFVNPKTGKSRSKSGLVGFIILYIFIFLMMTAIFGGLAAMLAGSFNVLGLDWLYFGLMSTLALTYGLLGSVATTYTTVYKSKDNDLLFSLPVSPQLVVASRLFGNYLLMVFFEFMVALPTIVVYQVICGFNPVVLITSTLAFIAISFIILMLACLLGWILAVATAKFGDGAWLKVILAMIAVSAYYYFCGNSSTIIGEFVENAEANAAKIKARAVIFYYAGQGGAGNWICLAGLILVSLALLLGTYYIMYRSINKIVTTSNTKARNKEKLSYHQKIRTPYEALRIKEISRLTKNASYMLNSAIGTGFTVVLTIVAFFNRDYILRIIEAFGMENAGAILAIVGAFMGTMNTVAAPSISLEGKSIWILQSIPVDTWKILKAKMRMQIDATLIPALVFVAVVGFLGGIDPVQILLALVITGLFVLFDSAFNMFLGVKFVNLHWTNEIAAIKQGAGAMLSLFGEWLIVAVLIISGVILVNYIAIEFCLIIAAAILLGATAAIISWLKTKGTVLFRKLQA